MSLNVDCACGKAYRLNDDLAGKKFRCKECNAVLSVPAAESSEGSTETTQEPGESETAPCPNCASSIKKDARICVHCGFDLNTGKRLAVKISKQPAGQATNRKDTDSGSVDDRVDKATGHAQGWALIDILKIPFQKTVVSSAISHGRVLVIAGMILDAMAFLIIVMVENRFLLHEAYFLYKAIEFTIKFGGIVLFIMILRRMFALVRASYESADSASLPPVGLELVVPAILAFVFIGMPGGLAAQTGGLKPLLMIPAALWAVAIGPMALGLAALGQVNPLRTFKSFSRCGDTYFVMLLFWLAFVGVAGTSGYFFMEYMKPVLRYSPGTGFGLGLAKFLGNAVCAGIVISIFFYAMYALFTMLGAVLYRDRVEHPLESGEVKACVKPMALSVLIFALASSAIVTHVVMSKSTQEAPPVTSPKVTRPALPAMTAVPGARGSEFPKDAIVTKHNLDSAGREMIEGSGSYWFERFRIESRTTPNSHPVARRFAVPGEKNCVKVKLKAAYLIRIAEDGPLPRLITKDGTKIKPFAIAMEQTDSKHIWLRVELEKPLRDQSPFHLENPRSYKRLHLYYAVDSSAQEFKCNVLGHEYPVSFD